MGQNANEQQIFLLGLLVLLLWILVMFICARPSWLRRLKEYFSVGKHERKQPNRNCDSKILPRVLVNEEIFIVDDPAGHGLLIDSNSDVCLFPQVIIPEAGEGLLRHAASLPILDSGHDFESLDTPKNDIENRSCSRLI